MSRDVKAPPLGQLSSETIDDLLDSTDLPSPRITLPTSAGTNSITSPAAKELVFTRPGTQPLKAPTKDVAPDFNVSATTSSGPVKQPVPKSMDFSSVTGDPGKAINNYVPPNERPKPFGITAGTSFDDYTNARIPKVLGVDESTPFEYTGFLAGGNATSKLEVNPVTGLPRHNTELGTYVDNPLNRPGTSDAVVANGTPVNAFSYTEGLTSSQQNSRNFFNGLQEFRQQLAPAMLPALLYTPQQLNPSVSGGFAPTAENKGPLSWLVDGPQEDINPFQGKFGASGGGLLGGLGWVFSRLSPTTYLKGVAMDVARSVAAGYEGGSAGLEALMKGGNFGDAFVSAASENYYANAPQARGLPVKTIFGNTEVGDFFTQSYTLAALSGANDTSFSGQGNNTLFTDGSNRNIVMKGESFNPFGVRDPLRSTFNTGALEAKEREQGKWFGHGYDQFGAFAGGLAADVFLEGRIDKVAITAWRKATGNTVKVTQATTKSTGNLQEGIQALRNQEDFVQGLRNSQGQKLLSAGVGVPLPRNLPDLSAFTPKPQTTKGGPLVSKRGPQPKSEVIQGEFVVSADEVARDTARRIKNEQRYLQPVEQRYLPPGKDPFTPSTPRVYSPANKDLPDVSFEGGGAIVPYSVKTGAGIDTSEGGKIVPAVLGVGGKPGGIPINPRVEDGRVFIAKGQEAVTVWDPKSNQFISSGSDSSVTVERVLKAPGKVDLPSTPKAVDTPLPEPPSGLRGDVSTTPLPLVVPKDTPNYTIRPTLNGLEDITSDHLLDMTTGIFKQNYSTPAKTGLGDVFTPPPSTVTSVAAESLTPSASSADVVRNMLSGDTPSTYNATLLAREPRDVQSMVTLAQTVMLPGGVRIVDESTAATVESFHQLNKRVESALVASGLNPNGVEASAIRRMFDRMGSPVPNKLDSGFVVEVSPRTLDGPANYVKPDSPTIKPTEWNPNGPSVPKSEYTLGVKTTDTPGGLPITRQSLLDNSVADRKLLVGKSVADGFEVTTEAVQDVLSPSIKSDVTAAKSYVEANLPKESRPLKFDYDTRTKLEEHQQLTQKLTYTNDVITDVSTQLTDVELQLAKFAKQLDELPDIGVYPLTDAIPRSPLTKEMTLPRLVDVEDIVVNPEVIRLVDNTVPIGVIGPSGTSLVIAAGKVDTVSPRPNVTIVTKQQLPDAMRQVEEFTSDFKGTLSIPAGTPTKILDLDSLKNVTVDVGLSDDVVVDMFKQGAFMIPVVKRTGGTTLDPVYSILSGERYVLAYKRGKFLDDSYTDRMSVTILEDVLPAANKVDDVSPLYHGTRVDKLVLNSVDPLEGASRSEYGLGVWLTKDQGVAVAASGRAVPNNTVPLSGRQFTDVPTVHEVDPNVLSSMSIVKSTDVVDVPKLMKSMPLDSRVFSDVLPYGDELYDSLTGLLGTSKRTYGELFGTVDDATRTSAIKVTGSPADEFELNYVQRIVTDVLRNSGVDGVTNGVNTVVYRTDNLLTKRVLDVSDIVGDSKNSVSLALHEVNLLQKSLDAEPGSQLLKVQLAEAKMVAASRIRDSLSDELTQLNGEQTKLMSDLMKADDVISDVAKTQRGQALIEATVKDERTLDSFTKELSKKWDTPCL
jgi:hypothetical protein